MSCSAWSLRFRGSKARTKGCRSDRRPQFSGDLAAMANGLMWDATTALEALGAADVALWMWEPEKDRLRLTGASRALGLGPLAPDCSSAALRALALPQDRAYAEDILRIREPGAEISARLRMR